MGPTGYENIGFSVSAMAIWLLELCGILPYQQPQNRNAIIRARFADGESVTGIAAIFGLSPQRIFQIITGKTIDRRRT